MSLVMKQTVLFITDSYPPSNFGGIGRYTNEFAVALSLEGYDVHVFTPGNVHLIRNDQGVTIHEIPTQFIETDLFLDLSFPIGMNNYLATMLDYAKALHAKNPISLVIAPSWNSLALPFIRTPEFKTIVVPVTGYQQLRQDAHFNSVMLDGEEAVYREAKYFHWNSSWIEDTVKSLNKVSASYEIRCPFGLHDKAPNFRRAYGSVREILFVGRLEQRKGIDLLLYAIPFVLKIFPEIQFRIIGGDSESVTKAKQFLSTENFDSSWNKNITFEGRVSDETLDEAYKRADLFIAPSRFESFGLIYIEAMMFGLPIIALENGQGIIINEQNGVTCHDDPMAIGKSIMGLIKDSNKTEKLGVAARADYANRFAIRPVIESLIKSYKGLM
jgi:glycogen(starch) synthase